MAATRSVNSILQNLKPLRQIYRFQTRGIAGLAQRRRLDLTGGCMQCSHSQELTPLSQSLSQRHIGSPYSPFSQQCQNYHADALAKKDLFKRLAEKIGFKGRLKYKKGVLQRSGMRMYLCAVELVDFDEFFQELDLPDTFNSWFRITELHIWMCCIRLAAEGREGTMVRNNMMKNLWEDVERRTKKLGDMASSTGRREGIQQLSQEFRASLYSYDEGLLADDKVLAGAVWRNFFEMQCEDAEQLEKVVHYIRRQVAHLDSQNTERVVKNGVMTFLSFSGNEVNLDRTKPILNEILKRS